MKRATFSALQERFQVFCTMHPYKVRVIDGHEWHYILCGQGQQALLLLPGAPGLGDTAFEHIEYVEGCYRVLSPSYPASIRTLRELIDGLVGIMEAERIEQAHIVGGSYSGMVAQCLARLYAERVEKIVLSHTGIPCKRRALLYAFGQMLIQLLPMSSIRFLLYFCQWALYQEVNRFDAFWPTYFRRVITQLTKADYLARLSVHIDFDWHYDFTAGELAAKALLIIESDNDTLVSRQERAALKALYPHASVHTFRRTGHSAWVTQQADYLQLLITFLGA